MRSVPRKVELRISAEGQPTLEMHISVSTDKIFAYRQELYRATFGIQTNCRGNFDPRADREPRDGARGNRDARRDRPEHLPQVRSPGPRMYASKNLFPALASFQPRSDLLFRKEERGFRTAGLSASRDFLHFFNPEREKVTY